MKHYTIYKGTLQSYYCGLAQNILTLNQCNLMLPHMMPFEHSIRNKQIKLQQTQIWIFFSHQLTHWSLALLREMHKYSTPTLPTSP